MNFEGVVERFCNRKVNHKEYGDFLDPLIGKSSIMKVEKGSKSVIIHYNIIDETVYCCRLLEIGKKDTFYLT